MVAPFRLYPLWKRLPFSLAAFVLLVGSFESRAQQKPVFIETELAVGKVIGNYPNFPPLGLRTGLALNYGVQHTDTARFWPRWMNYPATGLTLGVHRMGNDAVYGHEIFLIPFVALSPSASLRNRLWFRMGMGPSYFTRHYFSGNNEDNLSIGSTWNWAFQVHMYKNWTIGRQLSLRAGLGYLHASNGHTQLPNFGINSFAAEVAATFYLNEAPTERPVIKPIRSNDKKAWLLHGRYGIGLQEFGGTTGPIGGAKRPVHCATVGVGWMARKSWKLKANLTYRYYTHINQQYRNTENRDNHWQASNLFFSLGSEFLMGHFGIDVEVGINIFKPYYRTFFDEYEAGDEFQYFIKRMFPSRFGMNAYLVSNEKNWKHNIYLGAFICANFGEADFTELSITYAHRIR